MELVWCSTNLIIDHKLILDSRHLGPSGHRHTTLAVPSNNSMEDQIETVTESDK